MFGSLLEIYTPSSTKDGSAPGEVLTLSRAAMCQYLSWILSPLRVQRRNQTICLLICSNAQQCTGCISCRWIKPLRKRSVEVTQVTCSIACLEVMEMTCLTVKNIPEHVPTQAALLNSCILKCWEKQNTCLWPAIICSKYYFPFVSGCQVSLWENVSTLTAEALQPH